MLFSTTPPLIIADTMTTIYDSFKAQAPGWGIQIGLALLIFFLGKWLSRKLAKLSAKMILKTKQDPTLANYLECIIYYTLLIVTLITAAGQLGVQTTSLITILGAAGLAIGLALKDSLSNFASGFMLITFAPFKVGDAVTAAGVSGKVIKISTFNTIINTLDNQKIIVPNAAITSNIITNKSANPTRRIDLVIGIGYSDDFQKAKQIVQNLIDQDTRILKDPQPSLFLLELGNSTVDLAVRPWVAIADFLDVKFSLLENIKIAFDQAGISFPYPQQDVHLYQSQSQEQLQIQTQE